MFFLRFGKWNSTNLETEQKSTLKKVTYVLSKNVFLIFWEIELSSGRFKKFQEKTFRAEKNITL